MNSNQKGLDRIQDILGNEGQKAVKWLGSISPDFADYIINFAYGDLYTRKGLSDRDRELMVVTSLIAQGNTGLPIQSHIRGMLNVGWKREEIIEVIIFSIGYNGFPSAVNALISAKEVFDSLETTPK
jgi:4-carboxymuconolactone decarboxylase